MDDIVSSGNTGIRNAEVKKILFELRALQQQLENSQNANNKDMVWHIKQYESAPDYGYPKFKKIRDTKSPRFNPELLKKVLWTRYKNKKY